MVQERFEIRPDILQDPLLGLRLGVNTVGLHQSRIACDSLQQKRYEGNLELLGQFLIQGMKALRV